MTVWGEKTNNDKIVPVAILVVKLEKFERYGCGEMPDGEMGTLIRDINWLEFAIVNTPSRTTEDMGVNVAMLLNKLTHPYSMRHPTTKPIIKALASDWGRVQREHEKDLA